MGDIGLNIDWEKEEKSIFFVAIYRKHFPWTGCEKKDISSTFKPDSCKAH